VQHDIALILLARTLLHEILDLEHKVVGKGAKQAEQRIIRSEVRDDIAHQRHHAGAAGALVFLDRRLAADNVTRKARGGSLRDDDAFVAEGHARPAIEPFDQPVEPARAAGKVLRATETRQPRPTLSSTDVITEPPPSLISVKLTKRSQFVARRPNEFVPAN
jgi:hypothetical protein